MSSFVYQCRLHRLSILRQPELLHQQGQGFIQLESVAGGIGEEESALSNKASSLDSISASRLFSFSSRSMSFSISFVRLSLSCSRFLKAPPWRQGGEEFQFAD
jgi:hypothetical protein